VPQNFLSLVPLALLLGEVTEDLAVRFGDTIGGLLNATFGNVVELILSIAALQKGLYDVVATSLVGSVLSNLLLVLGAPRTWWRPGPRAVATLHYCWLQPPSKTCKIVSLPTQCTCLTAGIAFTQHVAANLP